MTKESPENEEEGKFFLLLQEKVIFSHSKSTCFAVCIVFEFDLTLIRIVLDFPNSLHFFPAYHRGFCVCSAIVVLLLLPK